MLLQKASHPKAEQMVWAHLYEVVTNNIVIFTWVKSSTVPNSLRRSHECVINQHMTRETLTFNPAGVKTYNTQ